MELKQYLTLFRRWAWLLIGGLVLGALGGYLWSVYQNPVYEASTRILVTRAPQNTTSDMTNYLTDQQLTQTYVQLLTTQPVIDAVSQKIGSVIDPLQISVKPVINTQIIQLTFDDNDPQRAAIVANTLVQVLINQNENLQTGRYATTEASLQAQIKEIQGQIDSLQSQINNASTQAVQDQVAQVQTQIADLQAEMSGLQQDIQSRTSVVPSATPQPQDQARISDDRARLAQIQPILSLYQQVYTNLVVLGQPMNSGSTANGGTRLSQLQTTLGLYQQIYVNLLNSLETVQLARLQDTPNVVQIEPATIPARPIRPRPVLYTALAGAIGLLLMAALAFLIEYLDDTLKTPEDIERSLGLSVIGYVTNIEYSVKNQREVYVLGQPRSPVSEAFRLLRTNLEFSGIDKPLRTILVTSAGPCEGKTTVSVNLAASIAQGGKSVILLDTDLRRPQIHTFFNLPNHAGFSDLFRGGNLSFRMVGHDFGSLKDAVVITSGNPPSNPTELLGSERMNQLLNSLKAAADVVVLDSPPSMVADAQILSAKVDGVILVVYPGHTQVNAARAAVEQMKHTGARILGVVLNRIPQNDSYYYTGYHYYHLPYYSTKKAKEVEAQNPELQSAGLKKPIIRSGAHFKKFLHRALNILTLGLRHRRREKVKLNSRYDWSYRRTVPSGPNQSVWAVRSKPPVVDAPVGEDEKSRRPL
ncbi:MAG TPA: polysaccharide biosynthesis tyrosine autokinase [Anaerolineales bacterium]|nr:polysaccharide biosynthesis tyrosine autokinase [Anaerolineales bacterium]